MLTWAERPGTLSPLSDLRGPPASTYREGLTLTRGRLPTG